MKILILGEADPREYPNLAAVTQALKDLGIKNPVLHYLPKTDPVPAPSAAAKEDQVLVIEE